MVSVKRAIPFSFVLTASAPLRLFPIHTLTYEDGPTIGFPVLPFTNNISIDCAGLWGATKLIVSRASALKIRPLYAGGLIRPANLDFLLKPACFTQFTP